MLSELQTKTKTRTKANRIAITFNKDDSIIEPINMLLQAYKGLNTTEVVKLAIVELAKNSNQVKSVIANKPKLFTKESREQVEKLLDQTRQGFKDWYLLQGRTEFEIRGCSNKHQNGRCLAPYFQPLLLLG